MKGQMAKVSARSAIAFISTKFRFNNDGWVGNALEWIGDALAILHCISGFEPCSIDAEVSDYKVLLPTCVDALLSVDYDGCYLPLDRPTKFSNGCCTIQHGHHRAFVKGPWLQTSFQNGTVTFHVLKTPTDDEGYPLIPNSAYLREALAWYVLREWLSQGNQHHTFGWRDADNMWEKWWPRAQNDIDFPKLYNQEAFRNMWVSLIPQINLHYNGNLTFGPSDRRVADGDIENFTGTVIG